MMKKRIILAFAVVFLLILLGSVGIWLGLRGREGTETTPETTTQGRYFTYNLAHLTDLNMI